MSATPPDDLDVFPFLVFNGAMAKTTEVIVTLTDDLDGSKADRTVAFAWDGKTYEIDLSKKNASALEKAISPYLEAARAVRGNAAGRRRRVAPPARSSRSDLGAVREWAKANGYEVATRGRIAQEIQDAYAASK